jgi:hypothetical protein
MSRHRWSTGGALACALALSVTAAAAPVPGEQDKPLAQVPAKSVIVVQLKGLERGRERLDAFLKSALPDYADLARQKIKEALDQALQGRKIDAVTKDGHIFVVFTELPDPNTATPKMAVLVPVKSYKEFRDGILKDDERKDVKTDPLGYENANVEGQPTYFVDRKNGYAVVTPDADVAATFTKKFDGIDGKLSKPLAKALVASDFSVYVDMAAVNKQYGDAIKQAQSAFEQILDSAPDKSTAEMAKRVYAPMFQAALDSTAVLLAVDLRPEGLLLHTEVEVAADSKTNAMFKGWKSLPASEMAKLPGGSMLYSSMSYTPAVMKAFGSLAYGFVDPDGKEGKAIKKLLDEQAGANPRSMAYVATHFPSAGLGVTKYDNPAKAVDAQLKLFKELKEGDAFGGVLKSAPVVKEDAQKHAGFTLASVGMKWDLEKTVEKQSAALNEDQKKALMEYMKATLGEGSNMWLGTDGKVVVQVTAKDWDEARLLLDRYVKGEQAVGSTQAYKDAVKQLPAENSMLMLADVPQVAEGVVKAISGMLRSSGLPLNIPPGFETPDIKAKTSFAGLAVTLEPGRASVDVWLPATSINDVYKMYVEKLLKPNF